MKPFLLNACRHLLGTGEFRNKYQFFDLHQFMVKLKPSCTSVVAAVKLQLFRNSQEKGLESRGDLGPWGGEPGDMVTAACADYTHDLKTGHFVSSLEKWGL